MLISFIKYSDAGGFHLFLYLKLQKGGLIQFGSLILLIAFVISHHVCEIKGVLIPYIYFMISIYTRRDNVCTLFIPRCSRGFLGVIKCELCNDGPWHACFYSDVRRDILYRLKNDCPLINGICYLSLI